MDREELKVAFVSRVGKLLAEIHKGFDNHSKAQHRRESEAIKSLYHLIFDGDPLDSDVRRMLPW